VIPETATSSTAQHSTAQVAACAVIPHGSGSRRSPMCPGRLAPCGLRSWPSGPVWPMAKLMWAARPTLCAARQQRQACFNSPRPRRTAGMAGGRRKRQLWRGPGRTGQPAPGAVCPCVLPLRDFPTGGPLPYPDRHMCRNVR